MTREEIINEIKPILEELNYPDAVSYLTQNDRRWLEAILKALGQEPCDVFDEYGNYKYPSDVELTEPNTATSMPYDYAISRQAVLDEAFEVDTKEYGKIEVVGVDAINSLPPVNLQKKTGYWIFCEGIKGKDNVERCSCCQSHWKEAVIYSSDTQEYLRLRLKYCPNCGAKMQEVKE